MGKCNLFFFPFKTTNWSETRKENSNTKELNSKEVRFHRPNFDLLATNWIKVKRCQLCGVRTYMVLNSSLWFWFSFRKRSSKISKRKLFVNLSFYCYFFCLLISFLFIHFIYLFFETLWSIAKSLTWCWRVLCNSRRPCSRPRGRRVCRSILTRPKTKRKSNV